MRVRARARVRVRVRVRARVRVRVRARVRVRVRVNPNPNLAVAPAAALEDAQAAVAAADEELVLAGGRGLHEQREHAVGARLRHRVHREAAHVHRREVTRGGGGVEVPVSGLGRRSSVSGRPSEG